MTTRITKVTSLLFAILFAMVAVVTVGGNRQARAHVPAIATQSQVQVSAPAPAVAATLIFVQINPETHSSYREVSLRLNSLMVAHQLGHRYRKVLYGSIHRVSELKGKLAQLVQAPEATASPALDLLVLNSDPSLPPAAPLALSSITHFRAAAVFGASYAAIGEALSNGGVAAVGAMEVAHGLTRIAFSRFAHLWARGNSLQDALLSARRYVDGVARSAGNILKPSLGAPGVYVAGLNPDLNGSLSAEVPELPSESGRAAAASGAKGPVYAHPGFAQVGLGVMTAMVPQAEVDLSRVADFAQLFAGIKLSAWEQLLDDFPPSADGLPSVSGEEGVAGEIWIDGDALRYLGGTLMPFLDGKFKVLLDEMLGIRLMRESETLAVAVYFKRSIDIELTDPISAPSFRPYFLHLPTTLRFKIAVHGNQLELSELAEGRETLFARAKIFGVPGTLYVRTITYDPTTGKAKIVAGVLGNSLVVVDEVELKAKKTKFDLWESIERNLDVVDWPTFDFSVLPLTR